MEEIESIEEKEEQNEEQENAITNSENEEKLLKEIEEDLEDDSKLVIGDFIEAPKFMQDNEYIKGGYLLNCNTF